MAARVPNSARSIVRHEAAAEDAAQEACATVYRTICHLRQPESFRAWFYRLVVRQAMADRKKIESTAWAEPAVSDQIESHVERMDMRAALAALPLHLRTVLILHHYSGLNSKEIGAVVGAPGPTVRFWLAQARRRIRKLLDGRSGFPTRIPTEAIL